MHWQQILEKSKISIKLLGFGVDFTFPESDFTIAHRVIKQLEDRRVLTDPPFRSDVPNCIQSVQEIRVMLTKELVNPHVGSKLKPCLAAMRSACRNFLDELQKQNIPTHSTVFDLKPEHSSYFHIAIGSLREAFGLQIRLIAIYFKIDVEDNLASIIPGEE